MKRITTANGTFAKWRVEEVLVRSVFNLTFVASRPLEVPNPPIQQIFEPLELIIVNKNDERH